MRAKLGRLFLPWTGRPPMLQNSEDIEQLSDNLDVRSRLFPFYFTGLKVVGYEVENYYLFFFGGGKRLASGADWVFSALMYINSVRHWRYVIQWNISY